MKKPSFKHRSLAALIGLTTHYSTHAQSIHSAQSINSAPSINSDQSSGLTPFRNSAPLNTNPSLPLIEEVQVVGIRASLAQAIESKRHAQQFVDAISADDMGKLPDANVAESLQRVSGVQVDRGIAGGSDVSIRGMRNNVILVNGRQITEAGGRGSRGPDTLESSSYGLLAMIPSKLVSRLEVTKQSGANDIEGALGGVVNIVTRQPLDHSGQQIITSLTGIQSALADDLGSEMFGLYSNTFADDTFGVQISASTTHNEVREDGLNTFSGYQLLNSGDLETFDPNGDGVGGLVHRDIRFWQINDERKRVGVNTIVQYAPNENVETTFDTFYSNIQSDRQRYWSGFWNCCSFTNPVFSDNDVLVSANTTRPVHTNTEFADASSEFISSALRTQWQNEDWDIQAELAYTQAQSALDQQFLRLQTATPAKVSFDLTSGDVPSVNFSHADLTSPDDLNLAILFDNTFARETEDTAFRLDTKRYFTDAISSLEWGVRYNQLATDVNIRQIDIRPNLSLPSITQTQPDFIRLFNSPDFFSGETSSTQQQYLVVNEERWADCQSLAAFWSDEQSSECSKGHDPLGSFTVDETFLATYVKTTFDTDIGSKNVSGNIGVRYVQRDLTSVGNRVSLDDIASNIATHTNHEVLPSAVVKIDWSPNLVIRAGLAKVVAFANTQDLNNGLRVFGDNTGQGGSPHLNPFKIRQADLAFEWYFSNESLLSAGLFYKDVDSFIIHRVQARDIPGFSDPITVSQRFNGEGGSIQGLELLYQQPFHGAWENFGVMATYSYIDSQTPFTDINNNTLPIPGLSENNVNLVLYYEHEAFGARLAYNWRDEYLDAIGNGNMGIYSKSYSDWVASVKYDLSDHVSINAEVVNLLDTRQQQYHAFEEAIRRNIEFGRMYQFTVSYVF